MKTITTTAIVALMTTTIGLSVIAPVVAQDTPPPQGQMQYSEKRPGSHNGAHRQGRNGGGMRGLLDFSNPDDVEIALVRLSQRIDLTPEQQPLFDTFKAAAMAAAQDFSGVLDSIRPATPAAGQQPVRPPIGDMFANRIAVASAQLAALEAVQPSATAFFDSLSEDQSTALMPQRRDRGRWNAAPMSAPPSAAAPAPANNN